MCWCAAGRALPGDHCEQGVPCRPPYGQLPGRRTKATGDAPGLQHQVTTPVFLFSFHFAPCSVLDLLLSVCFLFVFVCTVTMNPASQQTLATRPPCISRHGDTTVSVLSWRLPLHAGSLQYKQTLFAVKTATAGWTCCQCATLCEVRVLDVCTHLE